MTNITSNAIAIICTVVMFGAVFGALFLEYKGSDDDKKTESDKTKEEKED